MLKQLGRSLNQTLSRRFPFLYYRLVQRPRIFFRFRKEKKLAEGANLSSSQRPSLLFFTTQKCASQYVTNILKQTAEAAGLVHADYDSYVAMVKVRKEHNPFTGAISKAFVCEGYFYGAIGTFRQIPDLDRYKVLLQLRDPRDLLTSLYYSTAYSHAIISEKLLRRRAAALQQDIDTFVLEEVEEYAKIFADYADHLLDRPNVLFVKYEEMVADFPAWLQRVMTHLELDKEVEVIEKIKRAANFAVDREDKYSQRRQVTPGDHKRKLRPETIASLDAAFSTILARFGYSS